MVCAAIKGLPDVVRLIHKIAGPESVNQAADGGWTPLHHAAYNGHVTVIKTLLELRGDPSLVNNAGVTPLAIAQHELNNHHSVRDCLQGWLQMCEERRNVIITYGWDYFEMPTWRLSDHSEFPAHLRARVHAAAVSLADIAPVLDLIAKGIDALKRKRVLEI